MKNRKRYEKLYDAIVVTNKLEPRFYKAELAIPYYVKCADYNLERWKDVIFETLVSSIEYAEALKQPDMSLAGMKAGRVDNNLLEKTFVSLALIPELVMYANNVHSVLNESQSTQAIREHAYECGLNPLFCRIDIGHSYEVYLWGVYVVISNKMERKLTVNTLLEYGIIEEPKAVKLNRFDVLTNFIFNWREL